MGSRGRETNTAAGVLLKMRTPFKFQTGTSTQGDGRKGHRRKAYQKPHKSKTSNGHREGKWREKNNKQPRAVMFLKEIAKVTPPLLNHLGGN